MSKQLLKHAVEKMSEDDAVKVIERSGLQFQTQGQWQTPQGKNFGPGDVTAVRLNDGDSGKSSLAPDPFVDVRPDKQMPPNSLVTEQLHNPDSRVEQTVQENHAKGLVTSSTPLGTNVPEAPGRL